MSTRRTFISNSFRDFIQNEKQKVEFILENQGKFSIYDICHHCKHVIDSGTLIDHLKDNCFPRKLKVDRLNLLQNPEE